MGEEEKNRPISISGLPNLGATCGINSLLQAIYHTRPLRELLLRARPEPIEVKSAVLTYQAQGLFQAIMGGSLGWKPAVSMMRRLVMDLYRMAGMQPGEQQDVTELWTYLADRFAEEMFDARWFEQGIFHPSDRAANRAPRELQDLSKKACQEARLFNKASASEWLHLVQGFYIQQVQCLQGASGCSYVTHSFQPATSLAIEPKNNVAEGLMNYFSFEDLHQSWRCDHCQALGHAQRVSRIWEAPPRVLVVSLKRFQYTEDGRAKKIHDPCSIPIHLEMGKGLVIRSTGTGTGQGQHAYQLSAVIQHYGSMQGGHYTCLASVATEQGLAWFHLDDANVQPVQDIMALLENNRHGYLLFYERL